jgi:hypothetical protein
MVSDPWLGTIRQKPRFADLLARAEQQHLAAQREFIKIEGDRILGIRAQAIKQ